MKKTAGLSSCERIISEVFCFGAALLLSVTAGQLHLYAEDVMQNHDDSEGAHDAP